jgi:hypothetical protein
MPRLHHDGDAWSVQHRLDGFGDLAGEPFLQLKAVREEVDEPRQLAETYDPPFGT